MNLNYNINNALLNKNRNFQTGKVDWVWRRTLTVSTGAQSGSDFVFGTGSITYVPYAPNQFFVSGGFETGSLLPSGSALGLPVYLSVTGSAAQPWPTTGSNTLYINIGGNLGFNQSTSSILSAAQNNLNLSGSARISSSFAPLGNQQYQIDFGITHTKGNIYNPLINWSAVKTSPFGNNISVNGEVSASFNIVKNTSVDNTNNLFTNVAFIKEVSGSAQSSSFNNEYALSVTSSYTASINNVTGSTTMSFVCAEEGLNQTLTFFNPTTTTAIGSASFVASNNTIHSLVTSINYNKGNISTASINYKVSSSSTTQDLEGNTAQLNSNSSSFNLKKDIAVLVNYNNITASISGTYSNDYSFNQTASLTSSILPNTTGSVTMSLEIPEIGFSTSSKFFNLTSTGIKILSASFETQTILGYNITASVINNKGNESNSNINWYVTGSAGKYLSSSSLNITKDANVTMVSQSLALATGSIYKNDYAFNQTASLISNYRVYLSDDSSSIKIAKINLEIGEIGFTSSKWISSSCATQTNIITSSFEAQTNIPQYNITASLIEYQIPVFIMQVTASGAGGGGGGGLPGTVAGGGGGGMAVSSSIIIVPNVLYTTFVPTGSNIGSAGGDAYMLGYNNCPNISYNMYAGGGKPGVTGNEGSSGFANGGASGTGSIVENGTTIATYNSFAGGTGSYAGGPYVQQSAGGGASNAAVGGNGDASGTSAQQGGDGASGYTAGGGGSCLGNSPAPPPPGRNGFDGTGFTGKGGGFGQPGGSGSLFIKYAGTGSKFVSTNAFISYDAINDITTYAFSIGSGTFAYYAEPTL